MLFGKFWFELTLGPTDPVELGVVDGAGLDDGDGCDLWLCDVGLRMLMSTFIASNATVVQVLHTYLNRMSSLAFFSLTSSSLAPKFRAHSFRMKKGTLTGFTAEPILKEPTMTFLCVVI